MAETDVPEPNYDAMSPSDRAFALFTAVEKARSKAIAEMRKAGREIDHFENRKAHQFAFAVWNKWAQPLLEERAALKNIGAWKVSPQLSDEFSGFVEVGQNLETQDFLLRADLNAHHITFIEKSWLEKNDATGTALPAKRIFCDAICFNYFSFPGNASFDYADFNGLANFEFITFEGQVDFYRTTFVGEVKFDVANFRGRATFCKTVFENKTSFNCVTFDRDVDFHHTTFGSSVDFFSSVFNGFTDFFHTEFKGVAQFGQADFASHTDFSKTTFSKTSDWTAINAVRAFNMEGARFKTQVPQFTQAHFTESPRFDKIELPIPERGDGNLPVPISDNNNNEGWINEIYLPILGFKGVSRDDYLTPIQFKPELLADGENLGRAPRGETHQEIQQNGKRYRVRQRNIPSPRTRRPIDQDDIAAYTALRRIAKQGEDHETERKAFKGEMRTQRIAGDHGLPYRIFSWAYDLFTDFGGSFLRPFLLWAALSIASVFIYLIPATSPINKTEQATCDCPAVHALQLSARNALLFATAGQRPFVTKSLDCLYGKEPKEEAIQNPTRTGPPQWLGLFGTVQTLLSAILIFFILLALRNRFKI